MRKNGILALLFHGLFILFILAPLLVVVAVSFTGKGYISMPVDGLSLRWFRAIFSAGEITDAFLFSLRLGLASACVAIVLAVPAALALARYRFAGRDLLMAFFMSPLMIPAVVLGVITSYSIHYTKLYEIIVDFICQEFKSDRRRGSPS